MGMKNLYGIIFAAMLSATIFFNDLYAQNKQDLLTGLDEHDFSTFTINGLVIGGPDRYTEQDIIDAFGQPDSVEHSGDFGTTFIYKKRETDKPEQYEAFRYCRAEISVWPPKNIIRVAYVFDESFLINGYVRVGDPISKAMEMGGEWIDRPDKSGDGSGSMTWRPTSWGEAGIDLIICPVFTYDRNKLINSVGVWMY